jgi:hypothetical protein
MTLASWITGALFALVIPDDRITNFLENDGTLKPLSAATYRRMRMQ